MNTREDFQKTVNTYNNTTLVIIEDNCEEFGEQFRDWVELSHPEIDVDYRAKCVGGDGGLFDGNGEIVEDETLWDDFCNSDLTY